LKLFNPKTLANPYALTPLYPYALAPLPPHALNPDLRSPDPPYPDRNNNPSTLCTPAQVAGSSTTAYNGVYRGLAHIMKTEGMKGIKSQSPKP